MSAPLVLSTSILPLRCSCVSGIGFLPAILAWSSWPCRHSLSRLFLSCSGFRSGRCQADGLRDKASRLALADTRHAPVFGARVDDDRIRERVRRTIGAADILATWAREFPSTGLAGTLPSTRSFVPIFEELLYRALILGHLLRLLPPWLALVVSTLLFAAGTLCGFLSGLSGVAYGLLYLRYRNLWLCILTHGAHNLVSSAGAALLAAYLHDSQVSMPMEMNLLRFKLTWTFLTLACFAMFLRRVFAKVESGPSVLLHGPGASVTTGHDWLMTSLSS